MSYWSLGIQSSGSDGIAPVPCCPLEHMSVRTSHHCEFHKTLGRGSERSIPMDESDDYTAEGAYALSRRPSGEPGERSRD
jgi:hypothetical protein